MLNDGQWYLVQCKPRESFQAEANLNNQGYQCFHSTYPVKRKIAGVVQSDIAPLFPPLSLYIAKHKRKLICYWSSRVKLKSSILTVCSPA